MKTIDQISEPAKVVKVQLESDLQGQCVDWMRRRGYWARKFSSMTQRSVPDYLFAKPVPRDGEPRRPVKLKFYTEFKRPGTPAKLIEKHGVTVMSTEAQYEEQMAMRDAGWDGFECSDFETFKKMVVWLECLYI